MKYDSTASTLGSFKVSFGKYKLPRRVDQEVTSQGTDAKESTATFNKLACLIRVAVSVDACATDLAI